MFFTSLFSLIKSGLYFNFILSNIFIPDEETNLDKTSNKTFSQRSLKPHEKRALNFLINEYLLLQNYKLTSITFSDENPDQVGWKYF